MENKIDQVGVNISEKATIIWNIANALVGFLNHISAYRACMVRYQTKKIGIIKKRNISGIIKE